MILARHGGPRTELAPLCRMWRSDWTPGCAWTAKEEPSGARLLLKQQANARTRWELLRRAAPGDCYRPYATLEERVRDDGEPFLAGPWMLGWLSAFANKQDGKGPPVTLYFSLTLPCGWGWPKT